MTDKALDLARAKVEELEAVIVQMFQSGQSLALWKRYLFLTRELDDLWAELDVSCWTLGLLSPWVPQEKHGEPTLAQLDGNILAFTPDDKPELWQWPTLRKSIEFLESQQVIGRDKWTGVVRGAASVAKSQPIAIRFESETDAFRQHLTDGLAAGDSVAEFKNRIKDTVTATESTVERNFRTSSKRAYLDGVDGVTRKNRFPYVKYVATTDNRTRPSHRAMDGKILKVGTPEYDQAQALQREYNCRCTLIPLTEKQAKREGADIPDEPKVIQAPSPAEPMVAEEKVAPPPPKAAPRSDDKEAKRIAAEQKKLLKQAEKEQEKLAAARRKREDEEREARRLSDAAERERENQEQLRIKAESEAREAERVRAAAERERLAVEAKAEEQRLEREKAEKATELKKQAAAVPLPAVGPRPLPPITKARDPKASGDGEHKDPVTVERVNRYRLVSKNVSSRLEQVRKDVIEAAKSAVSAPVEDPKKIKAERQRLYDQSFSLEVKVGKLSGKEKTAKEVELEALKKQIEESRQREIEAKRLAIVEKATEASRVHEAIAKAKVSSAPVNLTIAKDPKTAASTEAREWLAKHLDARIGKVFTLAKMHPSGTRPNHYRGELTMAEDSPASHWIHEIGHALEHENPEIHELAKGFLFNRVGSSKLKPIPNFPGEFGREGFEAAFGSRGFYVSKETATSEITSMGLQKMYEDPVDFAKKDPEYFDFIVGIMTGALL